jgi:hypothetical protein
MTDERPLTLRPADPARVDLAAIGDDLDFIKCQLARIPTRKELARLISLGQLASAALCGIAALFR